jgi:5-methylthioadenosine/S-adenosylhomocysteine deaminase
LSSILYRNVRIYDAALPTAMSPPTNVRIDGDRISAIGVALPPNDPATRIIEGCDNLLMPGLINAHFHSPVNHMKGALDSLPLEIFMLYESPALETLRPTAREAYLRTLLAATEMLRGGVTAVQDDAFFVPAPSPDIIDAVLQAYADSGLRATVALDQPERAELEKLPFLAEMLPPALRRDLSRVPDFGRPQLLEAYRHLIETWHGHDGSRLRAGVSCSAPQRVSAGYFEELNALSESHDLPFYAHMLETKVQRVFGQRHLNGRSLVRYVADLGLLSPRMNIIHAIWTDDNDLDLIAESGAVIAHNPISNLRLGSGIMPFRRIRSRGIPICLGTDEAIADDAVNMWAVAKMTGLIHNISDPDYQSWPCANEVLECLISGGARAMGLQNQLGVIATGRLADLVLVDLDTLPFTPLNDLRRQLVYCESGTSVLSTMVAGRIVYEHSRVTTLDESALRSEARELFGQRQTALAEARGQAAALLPYYQAMYRRAAAEDVGMTRWAAGAAKP